MEVGLEGNSIVKSTRYLIVIFFSRKYITSKYTSIQLNDSLSVRYPATQCSTEWLKKSS